MEHIHRKIASHFTFYHQSLVKNGILSLSREGKLLSFETNDEPDSVAGVEFYSGILIPDMVNAHCHLELSYMRGAMEGGGGFASFARGMASLRHDFSRTQIALQAKVEDARMWSAGIGAVGDICNSTDTFGVKRESRIEYLNFLELFGLAKTSADDLLPVAQTALDAGLSCGLTPHSTYSLCDEAFVAAIKGAEYSSADGADICGRRPLSIHFMESPQESEMFEGRGELWNFNQERGMVMPFTNVYASPADRLIALVPQDRDILLIHNCCVTETDIDKIHSHFKGRVTWVLCPRSNDFISRIGPPVELLRRKGAKIALGTDSLASNRSLDMAEEMKYFKGVPLGEILGWATANGADALQMAGRVGRFEVGSHTGVVRLSGVDMNDFTITENFNTERIV